MKKYYVNIKLHKEFCKKFNEEYFDYVEEENLIFIIHENGKKEYCLNYCEECPDKHCDAYNIKPTIFKGRKEKLKRILL